MVLLDLIDKYNENGIFIRHLKKIWWFNGKRLEHWTDVDCFDIIYKNNKLYLLDHNFKTIIYENGFVKQSKKSMFELSTRIFKIANDIFEINSNIGGNRYCHFHGHFVRHSIFKSNGFTKYKMEKNRIYAFSYRGDNEYYDIIEHRWHIFKAQILPYCFQVYFFNELFYIFTNSECFLWIYDPKLNSWYKKTDIIL